LDALTICTFRVFNVLEKSVVQEPLFSEGMNTNKVPDSQNAGITRHPALNSFSRALIPKVATGYLFKDPWLSEPVLKRGWQINLQKSI